MGEICDFGQCEKYIISPSYVHSLSSNPSTPVVDEIPVDETELTNFSMTSQSTDDDHSIPYSFNHSLTPSTSNSHIRKDDVKDTPVFPSLQRCASEYLPKQQNQPSQLLLSRTSEHDEHDELRHREISNSFDLDELSPSASPPPNLVEYTHQHRNSVGESEEEGDKGMESKRAKLVRKRSRRFSWQALLEDTTSSLMGYMRSIPS